MNKYEEKMKKIEDLLSTSNQKELNRLYDFFAELGHIRNTYENHTRRDVARVAFLVLGGEYHLRHLPLLFRDGIEEEAAEVARRMYRKGYGWDEITIATGVTPADVFLKLEDEEEEENVDD